jgi:hypothetical protein
VIGAIAVESLCQAVNSPPKLTLRRPVGAGYIHSAGKISGRLDRERKGAEHAPF